MIYNKISKETIYKVFDIIDKDYELKPYNERVSYSKAICKIQTLFRMGYVPSRSDKSYELPETCNCISHAICNLDNDLYESIMQGEKHPYLFNLDHDIDRKKDVGKAVVQLVKDFGLGIKPCRPNAKPKSNQWKIGIYCSGLLYNLISERPCYHATLQKPGQPWEDKAGWYNDERSLNVTKAPVVIDVFFRDKIYMITNPYACCEDKSIDNKTGEHYDRNSEER